MADGHLGKCKACCKLAANKHRSENLDKVKAYDRERGMQPHRVEARRQYQRTDKGKAARAAANKRWAELQPIRKAANIILNNAIKSGAVVPWPVCSIPECSETKLEAHHPDYTNPLGVVWLCNKHHRECHDLFRTLMREEAEKQPPQGE